MGKGKADYYADGQWNFYCDLCGAKTKSSDSMLTWSGLRVCKHHKEVRNPQDFLRGVKDDPSVPWSRPNNIPVFVPQTCTLRGKNAIPTYAVPGCAIPSLVNLAFIPSDPYPGSPLCTLEGLNGIPSWAVPGCAFPRYNNLGIEAAGQLQPGPPQLTQDQIDTTVGII